jgi:hypothetical protein
MSAFSTMELKLVQEDLCIDSIFDVLVKGCWIEESDHHCMVSNECIEFTGGFHESYFKITLITGHLVIVSDSPWELEVLTQDLKGLAVKKADLVRLFS